MKARRSTAALVLLVLAAGGQAAVAEPDFSGPEPPRLPVVLRQTPLMRGAMWYSATVLLPAGSWLQKEIQWQHAGPWTSDGCFTFTRYADGSTNNSGNMRLAFPNYGTREPQGRYGAVSIHPRDLSEHPLTPTMVPEAPAENQDFREGSDKSAPILSADRNRASCANTMLTDPDSPEQRRQDILVFVASDGPLAWSRVKLSATRGVRVLAESWGTGSTRFLREWDFSGGVTARAGEGVPVDDQTGVTSGTSVGWAALGTAGMSKTLTFRRRAVAFFATGRNLILPPVCVWPCSTPSILSVTGPGKGSLPLMDSRYYPQEPVGPRSDQWHGSVWANNLVGEPRGRYRFGVEAFASSWILAGRGTTPKGTANAPYVVLATADADFPACTTLRVRAFYQGHPVCR